MTTTIESKSTQQTSFCLASLLFVHLFIRARELNRRKYGVLVTSFSLAIKRDFIINDRVLFHSTRLIESQQVDGAIQLETRYIAIST